MNVMEIPQNLIILTEAGILRWYAGEDNQEFAAHFNDYAFRLFKEKDRAYLEVSAYQLGTIITVGEEGRGCTLSQLGGTKVPRLKGHECPVHKLYTTLYLYFSKAREDAIESCINYLKWRIEDGNDRDN